MISQSYLQDFFFLKVISKYHYPDIDKSMGNNAWKISSSGYCNWEIEKSPGNDTGYFLICGYHNPEMDLKKKTTFANIFNSLTVY